MKPTWKRRSHTCYAIGPWKPNELCWFACKDNNNPREIHNSNIIWIIMTVCPALYATNKLSLLIPQRIGLAYFQRRKLGLLEIKYLDRGHRASKDWSWHAVPALSDFKVCVRLTILDDFSFSVRQIRSLDVTLAGNDLVTTGTLWVISEEGSPRTNEFWLNSLFFPDNWKIWHWRGASLCLLWNVSSSVTCFWFVGEFGKTSENTSSP